jgi:hypothetical protein
MPTLSSVDSKHHLSRSLANVHLSLIHYRWPGYRPVASITLRNQTATALRQLDMTGAVGADGQSPLLMANPSPSRLLFGLTHTWWAKGKPVPKPSATNEMRSALIEPTRMTLGC